MTLVLDTSALVKLVISERETPALRRHLRDRPAVPRAACGLVRTELRRAVRRVDDALLPGVERLLSALALIRVDDALLDTAGMLGPQVVRSLDAVHLAAVLRIAPVTALVTYDRRMQDAARSLDVAVVAPGQRAPA